MASLEWINYHRARAGEPLLSICGGDIDVEPVGGGVYLCSACRAHSQDSDCSIDPGTECCRTCGVDHSGPPCPHCDGVAFHAPDCEVLP